MWDESVVLDVKVQLDARDKGQQPRIQEGPYQASMLCYCLANELQTSRQDMICLNVLFAPYRLLP